MEITEIHFDSIDSTSSYAKREYASFATDKITIITAEEQTAGRGRYQRKWLSPKGVNLYATLCFRLPVGTLDIGALSIVTAHALTSVLLAEGLHPSIKWPNDVLLNGKKVAGILCETIFEAQWIQILLGIGVNVNMEKTDLERIDQPATSLKNETGKTWNRSALMNRLRECFSSDLDLFKKSGFAPFHDPMEKRLEHKGKTIRCFDGKTEWVGICHSLGNDGRLNLLLPNGQLHALLSGDISIQ